ncbi:alginate export family protein [Pelagibius sp.]|uniref:alginate export family protein n=1 Tax=Pelagibius sp. TaxID=1931238 RepID=UPI003B500BCC
MLLSASSVSVAAIASTQAVAQDEQTAGQQIQIFRWAEDYSYIEKMDRPRVGFEHLKWLPMGSPDIRLNLGGQYRLRLDSVRNPSFGLVPGQDDFTSVTHRFLAHGDLHVGDNIRAFAELGYYVENGREPRARPFDESDPDIQQAFLELRGDTLPFSPTLRLGRQEIVFGAPRFLSLREGANTRRRFDAVRLDLQIENSELALFAGRPIELDDSAFSDSSDDTESVWGIYLQSPSPISSSGGLDLAYIGRRDEDEAWAQGVGSETRHTFSARAFGQTPLSTGTFDYDIQGGIQTGSFADGDIFAWGLSAEAGYQFDELPWTPRIAMRANAISGDDDLEDPDLGTLNALYPNLGYFTDATTFAPANMLDAHPFVEFRPHEKLTFEVGADFLFRMYEEDAVYGAGYIPLVPAGQGGSGQIATLVEITGIWAVTDHIEVKASYVRGIAGSIIDRVGGNDFDFGLVHASFRF